MCVHLESTHMYRILAVPFSRFFRVTFDYPRLSLCHVKNYWICYIRYIFLLRCDDHLKTESTKLPWSDGRVMDSLLVISISISIFSIDYLLFSLISIREERFIKYFSVLENCFLRFYFRFYSYHLPDIFFENRKEKIIRMYVFSKCFFDMVGKLEECIIHNLETAIWHVRSLEDANQNFAWCPCSLFAR